MTLIIGKNSVEERVKRERRENEAIRRQDDVLKGLSRSKEPQRGDFNICRKLDRTLEDYRRHKNPEDRKKIVTEYYGLQKERRA